MSLRSVAVRLARRRPSGPPAPDVACLAPFSSMYLDPRGFVRACCMNDYQLLGNVADARLLDIWHGEKAQELRRAMERHDLSIGCEFCQWQVDEGRADLAFSRWFTEFRHDGPEPAWPQMLELAMSNTCNLQCTMCNAEWSSSIRSQKAKLPPLPKVYDDRFFEDLAEFLPHLTKVKFLGGEPFLAGEALRVMDMLVDGDHGVRVHATTNGTQFTPRVERILAQLPVEVAVSLDAASPDLYESIRVGSSWDVVMANLDRFQERCIDVTVTYCLMRTNWQDFGAFCRLADDRGIGCAVNVVTEPAHLSLYTMAAPDLRPIVEGLEAEGRRIEGGLGRSLATWRGEVEKLRRHLEQTEAGTPVTGLQVRKVNEEFPRPFGPVWESSPEYVAEMQERIASLADRHLGEQVGLLEVGADQRIEAVVPPEGFFGIEPDTIVGTSVNGLLEHVEAAFGDLEHLQPIETVDDASVFEARFADGTVMRSMVAPSYDAAGERAPGTTVTVTLVPAAG